ncbi:hypothetical protein [Endozoicomonas sp. 8E]|uniref:hypothetical protein n=1 Tax=Endozoicomonas sp. 8E TaxID=3035692 RepID=UPI002938D0BF|nr:hypothetical protein [Endozoicomonas sp. 8E]WOG26210.1 hypothetical protein P6910_16790 [Endozoicomonas sp. 8E]
MMNVNSQATGHPIVDQGTQAEPDTGSSVGQFLKRSVKEISIRNIFWDVDEYNDYSDEGKLFIQFRIVAVPPLIVSALCFSVAKNMSCSKSGIAVATALGWLAGSKISRSIGKEFFKEHERLESEAIRNAVFAFQSQQDFIQDSNSSIVDEDLENPPPSYEECVPDITVQQRVNNSDGSSAETEAE